MTARQGQERDCVEVFHLRRVYAVEEGIVVIELGMNN